MNAVEYDNTKLGRSACSSAVSLIIHINNLPQWEIIYGGVSKWGCAGKCMFQGMSASVREDAGGRGRDKVERVTR